MTAKFSPGDKVVFHENNGGLDYYVSATPGDVGTVQSIVSVGPVNGRSDVKYNISFDDMTQFVFERNLILFHSNDVDSTPQAQASKPKPKVTVSFDSVIIEDEKREQILEALEQVNQYELIFEKWGFGETMEKGKGVSILLWGPPGTGKTMCAQAIANKLDVKLKIIATADIESSSPGESERNIRKHFKDAKDSILLFDEADGLVYSRQNVGPILAAQINELLSQLERHDGITIFTTNRLGTLDEAMNRRLALKLEFSMPTVEQRAQIWQRMFPKKCPLDKKIDWQRLAGIEVSGGYIKNAVLRAARMAATEKLPDSKKRIRMKHLVKALALETEAMIEFEEARQDYESRFASPNGLDSRGRKVVHTLNRVSGRG